MSARGNAERGFEMKRQTQLFQERALMNATGYEVWLLTVRGWAAVDEPHVTAILT
jgi:hypothetical protein